MSSYAKLQLLREEGDRYRPDVVALSRAPFSPIMDRDERVRPEKCVATAKSEANHERTKLDETAFLFSTLMLAPWYRDNILRFMTVVGLIGLIIKLNSNDPKERREANRELGRSEPSKKKRAQDEDADDADDDVGVAEDKPNSPLTVIFAPAALAVHNGWQTLSIVFGRATQKMGRLGLKAINAVTNMKAETISMPVPHPAPGIDATI